MTCRTIAYGLILFVLVCNGVRGQGLQRIDRVPITSIDSQYVVPDLLVVPGTLRLYLDDSSSMIDGSDYHFDSATRTVRLSLAFRVRVFADTVRTRVLRAEYRYRPVALRNAYYLRRLDAVLDSGTGRTRSVMSPSQPTQVSSEPFGAGFQRSGSIIRGVTLGTNRDLVLQSGLRLQFRGEVSKGVEVLAALADEQSPLQPEGTTQTLREVDNIFFEVRSPWVGGTLGQFVARSDVGAFTSFDRKLQGVTISARPDAAFGTSRLLYAVSPGRFRTQTLTGREGDQGPYRLSGTHAERDIVLVAGTERVFLDGDRMTRGEKDDYVIDYSSAEITFTPRHPITSASRITVDFEYTDQKYSRSFISLSHTVPLADSTLTLAAAYVREGDDPGATVDITLSDADRALLAAIGGDRLRGVRTGVSFVGRTDSIQGQYTRTDTVIDGRPDSLFLYSPTDTNAIYLVSFSIPPDGVGDYRYVAFGQYEYVGRSRGRYLPVVYLPLPELRQVGSVSFSLHPSRGADIKGDLAFSGSSLNRFSNDPTASLSGMALSVEGRGGGDSVDLFGMTTYRPHVEGRLRYLTSGFRTVDRLAEVEFDNRWNTTGRPGEAGRSDLIAEAALGVSPLKTLDLTVSAGLLQRQGDFRSIRGAVGARLQAVDGLPGCDYSVEAIGADSVAGSRNDLWLRHRGGVVWPVGDVVPGFRVVAERRIDVVSTTDTLAPTSFAFVEFGPEIGVATGPFRATASFRYYFDDSVRGTGASRGFVRDGAARTVRLRADVSGLSSLGTTLDVTWRIREYDPVPEANPALRLDNSTLAVRSLTRWSAFDRGVDVDLLYEGQSERAARLERLFVRVPFGQGDYVWHDLDSNHFQSPEEFRLTNASDGEYVAVTLPTEELFPVIDLRTSLRVRTAAGRFLPLETTVGRLLAPLTTETLIRIDEKSQSSDEASVYLLSLSSLLNDSTTLSGTQLIQQDVHLYESNPDLSLRLRLQDRRGMTKLVSSLERIRNLERSMRLRWRPTADVGLQFDVGFNAASLATSDPASRRSYDITSTIGTGDLAYRPFEDVDLGWTLTIASTNDVVPTPARSTSRTTNAFRGIYSLENHGRIRVDVERTNVAGRNVGGDLFSLPYQLTDGYGIGDTWVARATCEYRFGSNIQASVGYTGRLSPSERRLFNIGRAEVRAYF